MPRYGGGYRKLAIAAPVLFCISLGVETLMEASDRFNGRNGSSFPCILTQVGDPGTLGSCFCSFVRMFWLSFLAKKSCTCQLRQWQFAVRHLFNLFTFSPFFLKCTRQSTRVKNSLFQSSQNESQTRVSRFGCHETIRVCC